MKFTGSNWKVTIPDRLLFKYVETIRKARNSDSDAYLYELERSNDHEALLKHLKGRISFNYQGNMYGTKSRLAMSAIMKWVEKEIEKGDREGY